MVSILSLLVASQLGFASWFDHPKAAVRDSVDTTGLTILGVGAAAALLAGSQDQNMKDAWINHQRMPESTSRVGDFWGSGYVETAIAVGQLILDTENGIASSEGLILSSGTTFVLKYSIARERPNSSTRTSFPSGHTQISFASATTIYKSYGWAWSIPMYGMGILTGLSRMADNAHWFSDVVAGATIGIFFGRAGFAHHWNVSPVFIKPGDRGWLLSFKNSF